ncbi:MAG: hypothetical protein ACRD0V_10455, partial [Acidimicrobiales bacterium]
SRARSPISQVGPDQMSTVGPIRVDTLSDNIADDEIIIETTYRPDPALWEPDFKTRRTTR